MGEVELTRPGKGRFGNAHPRRGGIRSANCVARWQPGGARQGVATDGPAKGRTFAPRARARIGKRRNIGAVAASAGWRCANQASTRIANAVESAKTAIPTVGNACAN